MAHRCLSPIRAAQLILLVLTMTLFAGGVGIFTLESRRFLGAICLAVMLGLARKSAWRAWRWWFWVTVFFALLWCIRQPELWLLLTAALIFLTAHVVPGEAPETADICHATTVALYAVLFLAFRQWPSAWVLLEKSSQQVTESMGRITGSGISYCTTASGFWVVFAFLALGGNYLFRAKTKIDRTLTCVFCCYTLVLFVTWLACGEALTQQFGRTIGVPLMRYPGASHLFADRALWALHAPVILLTVGLALAVWLLGRVQLEIASITTVRGWKRGLLTGSALAIGVLSSLQIPMAHATGSRVLFYGNGMLDWRVPIHGVIGIGQAGMFGLLPRYLEAAGFQTRKLQRSESVAASALKNCDVFVVINPTRYFSAKEMRDVLAFVHAGGALLVLGDHTDLCGIMGPLNQLLEPVPIRYRFDSAFSIRHWVGDYEWFDHPVTRRLDSSNDLLQQGTGASLQLGSGAFPLVVGKFAFSDAGDHENKLNAYLGDYRYETGELLSDAVIIAGARYGAGRIVVFGDTTAFQNVAICRSASFVVDVFAYLSMPERKAWFHSLQLYLVVAAGLLVLGGCFWRPLLPQFGSICLAVAAGMWLGNIPQRRFEPVPFQKGPFAFIDTMHVNRFSLELWLPDSIGGLTTNLARNGFLPMILRDAPMNEIRKGKILICIAPAKPYTPRELKIVEDFMQQGGLVIVATGYQEKEGARGLLALANCDIDSSPLGPVPIYKKTQDDALIRRMLQEPHMMEAWPILSSSGLDKTYYRSGASDIIGFKRIGRGGMLVIGDTRFLFDKTLEEETTGWPGNLKLLQQMLEQLVTCE